MAKYRSLEEAAGIYAEETNQERSILNLAGVVGWRTLIYAPNISVMILTTEPPKRFAHANLILGFKSL
jgi:hypothetical protein